MQSRRRHLDLNDNLARSAGLRQDRSDALVECGEPAFAVNHQTYEIGIGHLLMMNHAGHMSSEKTRRSLELFAREVYPAIRELGVTVEATPETAAVR